MPSKKAGPKAAPKAAEPAAEAARMSVEQAVTRSLKRTHEMYLANYGQRLEVNEERCVCCAALLYSAPRI